MSNPAKLKIAFDTTLENYMPAKRRGMLGVFLRKPLLSLTAALIIVLTVLWLPRPGPAQECPAPETKRLSLTPIIRDMVNPTPSERDFELPMPCGGKMILRHVCVPAEDYLADEQLNLGCVNCGRPDQGFMDGKHIETLAGVFKAADLPESWQVKLRDFARQGDGRCPGPEQKEPGAFYYFIGKYEVATFQWKAIMNNECPGWDVRFTSDDPRPVTNISWFEAVEFTRRYTEWLLKNRPDVLPSFGTGRTAYIRLPTETEWEYAARGGHLVTESEINQEDFFPLNNRTYSDYAVYTGADAAKPTEKLAWIGTRCSNPLGLFDTAGNAAEMLLDPFRFSIDFRLHGAAGGFVVKGGSYRKRISEIMPGRREEMPFFLKDGPFRSTDLGFRIVLSGIVNPHERNEALRREWADIARPARKPESAMVIDPGRDLLSEIERLIAAAKDEVEQKNLFVIKDYLQKANARIAEQKAEAFEAVIWKALFAVESIHKFTARCKQLQKDYDELKILQTQPLPETEMESLKKNLADLAEQIRSCDAFVDYFVQSYLDSIAKSKDFPENTIAHQFDRIFKSPRLAEKLRPRLEKQLDVVKKHMTLYNNHPDAINFAIIKEDILNK
jgi:hypothetical protein